MTQEKIAEGGGPSVATVRNIETNRKSSYRRGTLEELDNALAWKPGTSRSIVDGTADPDPTTWEAGEIHRTISDTAGTTDSLEAAKTLAAGGAVSLSATGTMFGTVQTPRRVAEDRIQELREQRGWTHAQLAQQCRNIGASHLTADAIAGIESHERGLLDINDVMALCYALDVAPVHVLAPIEDAPDADDHRIQVADRYLKPAWIREWIRGEWAPSDIDWEWFFHRTVPETEWRPKPPTVEEIERSTQALRQSRHLGAMTQPHRAHPDFDTDDNEG